MVSPDRQVRDEPQLQLPDLDVIAHCHQTLAAELVKFSNVPAFNVGAAILTEMREMRGDMREMRGEMREMRGEMREMREGMQGINVKIDCFDARLKAMEFNNVARLINSTLVDPDAQLSPLRNVATNEVIDQFPATARAIRGTSNAALDIVLRALGIEIDGRVEQKRQRIRVQIGLRAESI